MIFPWDLRRGVLYRKFSSMREGYSDINGNQICGVTCIFSEEILMKKVFSVSQILLIGILWVSSHAIASTSHTSVQQQLSKLEATSDGRLGISAVDTSDNRHIQYRGDERFPMGCTSKVI